MFSRTDVLKIVDAVFHEYASAHRTEAKESVCKMMDRCVEADANKYNRVAMKKERLERIKEIVKFEHDFALKTLEGETDNYDGADGARSVDELCCIINELIAEIEI